MATTIARTRKTGWSGSVGFNLATITVAVALGGLALAYALDGAGRKLQAERVAHAAGMVTRTVAGRELTIPRALLRYDEQETTGFAEEVELRLPLPLGARGALELVDVTLVPRSRARPSAALLDGVYLHQFTQEQVAGPIGLVGKPLKGGEGYQGETVWYDALSPNPFVAKCQAPVPGEATGRCLRTVFFANVAAVYAFDGNVLESWRRFDDEVEAVLTSIGVQPVR